MTLTRPLVFPSVQTLLIPVVLAVGAPLREALRATQAVVAVYLRLELWRDLLVVIESWALLCPFLVHQNLDAPLSFVDSGYFLGDEVKLGLQKVHLHA